MRKKDGGMRERKSGVGLGWKEDVCGRSMLRVEEANEWFVSKERLSGGDVWSICVG